MKDNKTLNSKDLLIVWENLSEEEKKKFKGGFAEYKRWATNVLKESYYE